MTRKMKDSGIEWIGEIPEDWEVIKNKYIFDKKNIKVGDKHSEYQLLSLTKKGIVEKDIEVSGGKLPTSFSTYQAVETNDIVLCLFDIDVSAVFSGISKFEGMISSAYDVFSINSNMSPDFYDYYFQLAGFNRSYIIYSKTLRKTINEDNFRSIFSIVPPLERQVKIARKLDQVILKIEQIINETQQSIEELKKYKQSLITEAVTKGLDPNVEMKDSGIEWIGKIPKIWSVRKISNYFSQVKDKNDELEEENLLSLSYGSIIRRNINSTDGLLPANFKNYNIVKFGDIVLRMTDLQNDKVSLRTGFVTEDGIITSAYITIRTDLDNNVLPKYIQLLLHSFDIYKGFYGMGSGVRQNVTYNDIKKIEIIVPPLNEQRQIVSYLDEQTSRIDKLIADKTKIIEELESYKQSLIYEYVTGKKEV